MKKLRGKVQIDFKFFILVSGVLCILYCLFFQPIVKDDSQDYIDFAKHLFNLENTGYKVFSHRSPLYSLLLGFFIILFGDSYFLQAVMYFQFFLIFLTSLMVYQIFMKVFRIPQVAFFSGLLMLLNLATIHYGYLIYTESIAMFLLVAFVYFLLEYWYTKKNTFLLLSAFMCGLNILARFNALGLPFIIVAILIIPLFYNKDRYLLHSNLRSVLIFTGITFITILPYMIYNKLNHGYFNLIPPHHYGQRWAIPSTINYNNTVTPEYEPVLQIFLESLDELKKNKVDTIYLKGSLLRFNFISSLQSFFKPPINGFHLYKIAEPKLLNLFSLDNTPEGIYHLGQILAPFYAQIKKQNKKELFRYRIFSLIYTFKHSAGGSLHDIYKINLNFLPAATFIIYKILFIIVSLISHSFSFINSIHIIFSKKLIDYYDRLIIYAVIWYYPLINFYANVLDDANRFRYPAEPFVIGLFVFLTYKLISWFNHKFHFSNT